VMKANEWAGMVLVIAASAGATRFGESHAPAPRDA
jgi:threonine/homoserine efflux transporter RhtA